MLTKKTELELARNLSSRWRLSNWDNTLNAFITQQKCKFLLLKTKTKTFVKFQVRGTVFELLARQIWDIVNPPTPDILISRQDDTYMTQIMARVLNKDSNCIDIGCHEGEFLISMLDLAPLGYHYAFEPIPGLAKRIKQKFPDIDVRQIALSDSKKEVDFHNVVSKPAYSGLQKRTYPDSSERVEIIKVKTDKLDNVLDPDFKVNLIKVDVEGAELLVFKGAIQTLTTQKPYILFEHGRGAADHYGTTPNMIYDLLVHECGLKIFRLKDWLNSSKPLSQQEFIYIYEHSSIWNFLATP